jgi:hypothetical protein
MQWVTVISSEDSTHNSSYFQCILPIQARKRPIWQCIEPKMKVAPALSERQLAPDIGADTV